MKTLILGNKGQLGQALVDTAPDAAKFIGFDLPELDITNAASVLAICHQYRPTVIVNAAAYTAVDQAESEIEIASAVNIEGPRNIAAAAIDVRARLIHISTDFVFDGEDSTPYKPNAATNPLSIYGRTKREGELAALETMPSSTVVVRTGWLYSRTGRNFVKTILRLMGERDELGVVVDQFGTPTWANSLATAVWRFADTPEASGIFHWTDGGKTNWHEFAVAIQEEALNRGLLDKAIPIHAITTEDYPTAATRPRYSVLDCSWTCAILGLQPAQWRENLHRMFKGMTT
jgi:dTDP-4-dehydrorhamnose reductase